MGCLSGPIAELFFSIKDLIITIKEYNTKLVHFLQIENMGKQRLKHFFKVTLTVNSN